MKPVYFFFEFKKIVLSLFLVFVALLKLNAQTTLINPTVSTNPNGSFENATAAFTNNGWTVVNDATAKWFVGAQSSCVGTKGAYIGTAVTNNSYVVTTTQVSHFYKDVTFPAGQTCITLSFDWKGGGESGYDGLEVFLGSTAATPVAGTNFGSTDGTAVQLGNTFYNLQASCGTVSLTIDASNAGATKRLVFSWENDGSVGDGVGATIDNISLVSIAPAIPNCATSPSPANLTTSISLCPTLTWVAPTTSGTCNALAGYDVYFGSSASPAFAGSVTANSYSPGNLSGSTLYYWQIRPKNAAGASDAACTTWSFTTMANTAPTCATALTPANGSTGVALCENLAWTAPSASANCVGAVTAYDVYFGTTSPPPLAGSVTTTYYNPASLNASTTYYYKIVPKNSSGQASGCSTLNFVTAAATNTNYILAGNASSTGSCVSLTSNSSSQKGCSWDINSTLNFANSFSYDYKVNLGSDDNGADGMAFVMQNDPNGRCACGNSGNQLGAGGISNSVIVELDTYINTEDRDDLINGVTCGSSGDADHLDIWINGVVNPNNSSCGSTPVTRIIPNAVRLENPAGTNYNIENGSDHVLRISWAPGASCNSNGTLTAKILDVGLTTTYGTVTYAFSPQNVFGTCTPYFGFTASTGGQTNNQTFCNPNSLIVLPIELLYFTAYCDDNNVRLAWSTATEINNDWFEVERSVDGINYTIIATIKGHGTTTIQQNYSYTDNNPQNLRYYYKLRQIDFDGKISYYNSTVSSDNLCLPSANEISLFPNPANDLLTIKLGNDNSVKIEIINDCGQLVYVSEVANKNQIEIATSNFASGVYAVRVSNLYKTVVKKLSVNH